MSEASEGASAVSLGAVAEGIAATIAVGFLISVVYDWGFVYALGLNFEYLPSTTTDHFRSGLLWLPPFLALVALYVAVEFQFQQVERGLTEMEIVENSPNPTRLRRFREGPYRLLEWAAPLALISYLLIGDALASGLPLFLSILWFVFARWCYSAPLIQMRRRRDVQLAFTFLPIIGILAFFTGYNAALDAASRKPIEVTVSRGDSAVSGRILRSFERGILLLGKDSAIRFLPWDHISAIENEKKYVAFRGVLCEWFKKCPEVGAPSKK